MQNYVFVIDQKKRPLDPIRPKRARQLLTQGKAAVFRRYPFAIILKQVIDNPNIHPITVKIDPGSKHTGFALLDGDKVIWLGELQHRGEEIKLKLEKRRAVRRGRRSRNTRYRKPRFLNRKRREGWLPPSLEHRVLTIETWLIKFFKFTPFKEIVIEKVKFDMQRMQNPDISNEEYQQGTLHGYTVREYLLEKWERKCTYCSKENTPLQIEHINPKSKGGSNRISNLCLACEKCNKKKGNKPVEEFLKGKLQLLTKIKKQLKVSLKDAAAVNATRNAIVNMAISRFQFLEVETTTSDGAQTKFNRQRLKLPKQHCIDAACAGEVKILKFKTAQALLIKSTGKVTKRMCRIDGIGFPCSKPRKKYNHSWNTGDIGRTIKDGITYIGKIVVQNEKRFEIRINRQRIGNTYDKLVRLHKNDSYQYSFSPIYAVL